MKTIFEPNNYDEKTVMYCASETQAETFLEFLHERGMRWGRTNTHYVCGDKVDTKYESGNTYRFIAGIHDDIGYYKSRPEIQILKFEDFDWEDDKDIVLEDNELLNFLNSFV